MVRSIGADHTIDYTKYDFTKSKQCYDLILGVNGYHSMFAYKRALTPGGVLVLAGGTMAQFYQFMLLGAWISTTSGKKMVNFVEQPNHNDLVFMAELLDAGRVKPIIDKTYPLSEVTDAIRYLEDEHARGKVVITVNEYQ